MFAIKNPKHPNEPCRLLYNDIGTYLTREAKLNIMDQADLSLMPWQQLTPNPYGDLINHRSQEYTSYAPLGEKTANNTHKTKTIFTTYSLGLNTNRDAWVYNPSKNKLTGIVHNMIDFYNNQIDQYNHYLCLHPESKGKEYIQLHVNHDPSKISWGGTLLHDLLKRKKAQFIEGEVRTAVYRPFFKQNVYFSRQLNNRTYQLPKIFPTIDLSSIGFYCIGKGTTSAFSVLMIKDIPDLNMFTGGEFFPRYTYVPRSSDRGLFTENSTKNKDRYERVDNITDEILLDYQHTYGNGVTKDYIFYYVYGLLHSSEYKTQYASDLKKCCRAYPK